MNLILTKRTDKNLLKCMNSHYSQPKGFVGRNLCYAIYHDDKYYGHIVGGSATRFLPGRNEFFDMTLNDLNSVINNIFFHIERVNNQYPYRNFVLSVLKEWRQEIAKEWKKKYGDHVIGFESLVELPRTGEMYKRDSWIYTGTTKGYTCKRIAGKGSDSWSGKRIWNTKDLRPKLVFCRFV